MRGTYIGWPAPTDTLANDAARVSLAARLLLAEFIASPIAREALRIAARLDRVIKRGEGQ